MASSSSKPFPRGGRENKVTAPKTDLAKSAYRAMGGGTVPDSVKAAIRAKIAQGIRPDTKVESTEGVGLVGKVSPLRPPLAPAVRAHISSTPKAPTPKPSIPAPKVQGNKPAPAKPIGPKTARETGALKELLAKQRLMGERSSQGPHGEDPRATGPEQSGLQQLRATQDVRANVGEAESLATPGRLGGAHAGGHGISEEEMAAGGKPLSAMEKLGSAGRIGARMATEEDLLP